MKAECLSENFKKAIGQIEKVAGKNVTLPILGAILIQTDGNKLIFRSTNLNIGAEIIIPAKITTEGAVAVSAQLLGQIASGLTNEFPISLETVNENLILQSKRVKMTLKSMNAEDFPTLPKVTSADAFDVPIEQFILGVKSVMYAASTSDIKPEIASIYLYPESDNLVFVATDAFRLAEKKLVLKNMNQFPEILLPVKNMADMVRILSEYSGIMKICVAENQISFSNDQLYLTSRLTGGTYPNYRQIMPSGSKTDVVMLKSDLQSVLKSLSVFSDRYNQISINVKPSEKLCTIESHNGDTGEGIINVDAALTGEDFETNLNQRSVSDALQSIMTDSVSFSFTEPNRAMVMRGVGDPSFTYLVMPMNR